MHSHAFRNRLLGSAIQLGALNLAGFSLPSCREAPAQPVPAPSAQTQSTDTKIAAIGAAAAEHLQRFEFQAPDLGSYETVSGKTLEEVITQVCSDELGQGHLFLMDVLLRIGQETGAAGLERKFSVSDADAMRAEFLAMAQAAAARLQDKVSKKRGLQLTPDEIIEQLNQVIYADKTRFASNDRSANELKENKQTVSIYATWRHKDGICEDLVGIYASVVDLLQRGGIKLPIDVIILPEHVLLRWTAPQAGDSLCIETTRWGETRREQLVAWRHDLELEPLGGKLPGSGLIGAIECELRNSICAVVERDVALAERLADCASRLEKSSSFACISAAMSWIALAINCPENDARYANKALEVLEQGRRLCPKSISIMQSKAIALRMLARSREPQIPLIESSLELMGSTVDSRNELGIGDRFLSADMTRGIIACWMSQKAWLSCKEADYHQARLYILEELRKDQWYGEKFEILGDLHFGFYRAAGDQNYLDEALKEYTSQIRYGEKEDQLRGQLKLAVALLYQGDFDKASQLFTQLSAAVNPLMEQELVENIRIGDEICCLIQATKCDVDAASALLAGQWTFPWPGHPTVYGSSNQKAFDSLALRDPRNDLLDFFKDYRKGINPQSLSSD